MPKRTDISSILIIGAGPIIIGQACEFDYSGVQAVKALKEEGYRVILVNSNPATIMTDPELADATYIEPITPEFVEKIIAKEKPDALLPTMGGQTALNCALDLEKQGVLRKYNVEMIGARAEAIEMAEDRELFQQAMTRIGLENPKSIIVTAPPIYGDDGQIVDYDRLSALRNAIDNQKMIGLPAIIRPAFTLGGTGGGVAYNIEEFTEIVRGGLQASPVGQVLIDESLLGWKEFEMEVVRDKADNAIIICAIENVDPMGVHTGDSITVAPALTLTDKEYQIMRTASLAVLREIGVETGGSNVQFAVNPDDGRLVVIEMNPRVSRSSALASKATGFPIARIAAKLAVGYTLDELTNDITGATPAAFEPTIDYVVTKIPRFAFEKFKGANSELTTAMKSVGEAMAIGRNFSESLQKALCSLETGLTGLNDQPFSSEADLRKALSKATPERILYIAEAFRMGLSIDEVNEITAYDKWFLRQIADLIATEARLKIDGAPQNAPDMLHLKQLGFSDARLAEVTGQTEAAFRGLRHSLDVRPVFKRIDTCSAEFEAKTPYMYSTYEAKPIAPEGVNILSCEAQPSSREKVMILGGGPNRIGQGIEFDYCCCHAAFAMRDLDVESIMVNCNPETVSTDYDTSDRLYFEPLTEEHVLEIVAKEQEAGNLKGLIVQFGGQTPLNLAQHLNVEGVPILGTSTEQIDVAEDRESFAKIITKLDIKQPPSAMARNYEEAVQAAELLGFPLMIRPSHVLGGRAMEIARDVDELVDFVASALAVSGDNAVFMDRFLVDGVEVDVDAICDGENVHICGIMEHIEEAGVHSGDSACVLPPRSLSADVLQTLKAHTEAIALALNVRGFLNVQYVVREKEVYVIEANPRASRTVPFVAKATNTPLAAIAAKIMAGSTLADFDLSEAVPRRIAVKQSIFPFARFPGCDPALGPEMRSTGESMGWDDDFGQAFLKAQIACGNSLPVSGQVFVSVRDSDKARVVELAQKITDIGFTICATKGTQTYLADHGIEVTLAKKVVDGKPSIVDDMINGQVALVFNTTEGKQSLADSVAIRSTAVGRRIPYFTTIAASFAALEAIFAKKTQERDVQVLQS